MASTHGAHRILVASNRGPVTYEVREDDSLHAKRGGGGLVSGLSAIGPDAGALWVCSALGDGDREAVRRGVGEDGVRMLAIDAGVHADAYNGIANSVLWFVHHLLYQTPLEPVFDAEFRRRWESYRTYNRAFAEALAEEAAEGAAVLVQDYHLCLVPGMLRELRPDLRIGHFSHTPWAPEDYFRMLPDDIRAELLDGMLGADRVAFLTRRWATAFTRCVETAAPDRYRVATSPEDRPEIEHLDGTPPGRTLVGVHGLGADAEFLRERSHRADVGERMAALREEIGATAGRSCASTGPSCPRTSCGGCWRTGSFSTTTPSGASGSSTWRSPTPRGRTSRCTGTTRPRCSASPTRSTPSTERPVGPRWCCT